MRCTVCVLIYLTRVFFSGRFVLDSKHSVVIKETSDVENLHNNSKAPDTCVVKMPDTCVVKMCSWINDKKWHSHEFVRCHGFTGLAGVCGQHIYHLLSMGTFPFCMKIRIEHESVICRFNMDLCAVS